MLTYAELRVWLLEQLADLGHEPEFTPGRPDEDEDVVDTAIAARRFPGPGLTLEYTYDRQGWYFDVAGQQGDYTSAETLAFALDKILLAVDSPRRIGSVRVLSWQRAGGAPEMLGVDNADRWHAGCSYVATVQSGM